MGEEWIGTREVADRLGITQRAVYYWVSQGSVRAMRVGDRWRIDARTLPVTIKEQTKKARGA